jgi:pimeloyl-ACP methyl ester carboxylesterase
MRSKFCAWLALLSLATITSGCGSFVAHRMAQAPNTYPNWFGSLARVELAFDQMIFTNFPACFAEVGPPAARLQYRVVEPADYGLRISSTNWTQADRPHFTFNFATSLPGKTNVWTASPRGTVVLLHGYGLAQFAMVPWALRLAEDGWRCVLVDLRGHGKSTGKRVYYGVQESRDLSQLLDALERESRLSPPIAAFGDSYGAALALRWKADDSRIGSVVAISPYASLSNAVLNLCRDYTGWLPQWLVKSGLQKLPSLLQVCPAELDTTTVLARSPVVALFVAADNDRIAPVTEVQRLFQQAAFGSELLIVPDATHEVVPYMLDELAPPVLTWLDECSLPPQPPAVPRPE